MSDRVSNFTSNQTLPQKVVVPSLTKRAGSKIPVPKVILQLAHKINFRGCKVAPEAPLVLREMSRNKVDPQAVMNALSSCEGNQPLTQLDDFQLYRLNKVNGALSEALKDYVERVEADGSTRPQVKQFLDRLESMQVRSDLLGKQLHPPVGQQGGRDSKLYKAFRSELKKNYESALAGAQIAAKNEQDRQAVLDRFMMEGEIDSGTIQNLLQETYRRLGFEDQDPSMGATFLKFSKVGTLVRDHFLKAVLAFLKNPLDPVAKEDFFEAQADLFNRPEKDRILGVKHLGAIENPFDAMCALHDIARQAASEEGELDFEEAIDREIRKAYEDGFLTKERAARFITFAEQCKVGGNSEAVRNAIRQFAATPPRSLKERRHTV